MRDLRLGGLVLALVAALLAHAGAVHAQKIPQYGAGRSLPGQLCYKLDPDIGPPWEGWIKAAIDNWNTANKSANTGWSFAPCGEGQFPDITFGFVEKAMGGAQGGPESGCMETGWYRIKIEKSVAGETFGGKTVKGGVGGTGWNIYDPAGETTLDPVLVMEHELSHAMGVDGDPGGSDTGNIQNPVLPGNHGKLPGKTPDRGPTKADTDAVKAVVEAEKASKTNGSGQGQATTTGTSEPQKQGGAEAESCPKTAPAPQPSPTPEPKASDHQTAAPRPPSELEVAVLDQINAARTDPPAYAKRLRPEPYVDLSDAIAFLQKQTPVPALTYDPRLAAAAIEQEQDQGPKGGESHTGSAGSRPSERMRAVGVQTTEYAEVISIAMQTPGDVVEQLIVDQPGPQRPHRADLFDANLVVTGVACGPNARFGTMCVIDLASRYAPPPPPP